MNMAEKKDFEEIVQQLKRQRDAYAHALSRSNQAFMDKVKEFSILKRLADTITWNMDKRQICTEIVDVIIDETTAENCSLWLVDNVREYLSLSAVKGQLDHRASYFAPEESEAHRMKVGVGAAGWVAEKGESLLIEDVNNNPLFVKASNEAGAPSIKSLLCLPVKGHDRVLGVLNLSHPDIGAFSSENERVLGLITDQAGIVLTNLYLFEEIQSLNRNLEKMVDERTRNLERSEARYNRAIEAGRVGLWDWGLKNHQLYIAPNLERMLGYAPGTNSGNLRNWLRLIHPSDRKKFLARMRRQLPRTGAVYEGEHRMYHSDGAVMWFMVRAAAIRSENGEVTHIAGSNTDITQRKLAELQLEKAQEEALVHAHAQGRAEFATTVLHNIGNVLNSVNVDSGEIRKAIRRTRIGQLQLAFDMIKEHKDNLAQFFDCDPKGRQLPDYIRQKAEVVFKEFEKMGETSEGINEKINLMRDIIDTQQTHARLKDEAALVDLAQLVEESLKIQMAFINRQGLTVIKRYQAVQPLPLPTARVIHVLINLIKNAIEAMAKTPKKDRALFIEIDETETGDTELRISDTGIGITSDEMSHMFTHGFTTKESGHGFGLHYCARALAELGGSIDVTSDGRNRGATFVLTFPKQSQEKSPEKGSAQ